MVVGSIPEILRRNAPTKAMRGTVMDSDSYYINSWMRTFIFIDLPTYLLIVYFFCLCFLEQEMIQKGFPAYTTSAGWLGYSDEQLQSLCHSYLQQGWTRQVDQWVTSTKRSLVHLELSFQNLPAGVHLAQSSTNFEMCFVFVCLFILFYSFIYYFLFMYLFIYLFFFWGGGGAFSNDELIIKCQILFLYQSNQTCQTVI